MGLNRAEAVALLKKLLTSDLVQPSLLSLDKLKDDEYQLIICADCDHQPIKEALAQSKYLCMQNEYGCLIIYSA
jgi:hypothetical protein